MSGRDRETSNAEFQGKSYLPSPGLGKQSCNVCEQERAAPETKNKELPTSILPVRGITGRLLGITLVVFGIFAATSGYYQPKGLIVIMFGGFTALFGIIYLLQGGSDGAAAIRQEDQKKSSLLALIIVSMAIRPAVAVEPSRAGPGGGPEMGLPATGMSSPNSTLRATPPDSADRFKGNKPTTQHDHSCQQRIHQHQPMGC